jgi:hypothetical protein
MSRSPGSPWRCRRPGRLPWPEVARCSPTIWWIDRPRMWTLFTPDPSEVTRLADALVVALGAEGAQVRVDRREPGFIRLAVTVSDGRFVVVEAPITHASAKRCSCRSAGCSTPKRWPPTRLSRCSAVHPPATWWMWRSGTRFSSCVSLPPRRTQVSTAAFSATRWPPPRLTRTPPSPNLAWSRRLPPPSGQARLDGGPNCSMPRPCPPLTLCGPSAHRRCGDRRRLALPALRDHLNVIAHHAPTRVATARHCPSKRPAAAWCRPRRG